MDRRAPSTDAGTRTTVPRGASGKNNLCVFGRDTVSLGKVDWPVIDVMQTSSSDEI